MLIQRKVQGIFLLLLVFNLAASQSDSVPGQHHLRTSDLVPNFFSELGDLIVDIDQSIAVQSQPKIEHEANVMTQLFRPQSDYFNRIQNNYKEMQKRIGNLIGNTIGFRSSYSDHELSTVSPPPENFVPTIDPDYNPFAAAAEARKDKLKKRISKESFEPALSVPKTVEESLKAFGKLSQAIVDDIAHFSRERKISKSVSHKYPRRTGSIEFEECGNEILEDPELEKHRQDRCSHIATEARENLKLTKEPKRITETLIPSSADAVENLSLLDRNGDVWTESDSLDQEERNVDLPDECSNEVLEDPDLEQRRQEKCSLIAAEERLIRDLSKVLKDSKKASMKSLPVSSKTDDSILIKRSGNKDESFGDSSDVSIDKQIRQLIKDHGSWILDYPLLKRWRQTDASTTEGGSSSEQSFEETEHTPVEGFSDVVEIEPTELYLPASTDYEMAVQKSGDAAPVNPHESYYKIMDQDGDVIEEEIEFVLDPESLSNDIGAVEPKETVILAFTSDGIPLKLRLGPEIDNPIKYLHKILQSAGVSLNIPVESYNDLEPVGKEVLKLGSGILTRATFIDASDSNELKSLIKALMVSKTTGATRFLMN